MISVCRCDVSDRKDVFKVAEIVKKEVGDITILINNAGIGEFSTFLDHVSDNIVRIVDINFMAHYWASNKIYKIYIYI